MEEPQPITLAEKTVLRTVPSRKAERNPRLDELRASAILMVVVFHVVQRWPSAPRSISIITAYGEYGVDLFFVLSGWLIGRLYWGEFRESGSVRVGRFIAGRLSRTVIPYLVALCIAWAGVYFFRGDRFDWGFLIFIQNYYHQIPYFVVSWSLCVEEHFYLILPFALLAIRGLPAGVINACFAAAVLFPLACRILSYATDQHFIFGFYKTATHFRMDGLVLSVWLAYISSSSPSTFRVIRKLGICLLVPATIVFLIVGRRECFGHREFIPLVCAVLFSSLLVSVVDMKHRLPGWIERSLYFISITSYSVYLTHSIGVDVSLRLDGVFQGLPPLVCITLMFVVIAALGALFYTCVERPVLALRRVWMKTPNQSLHLTSGA